MIPAHGTRLDSYWRTRTIAEAQSQGYMHLRVTCAGCGRVTDIPWQMLLERSRVTPESFIGNVPLRCQKCGSATPAFGVGHKSEGPTLRPKPSR